MRIPRLGRGGAAQGKAVASSGLVLVGVEGEAELVTSGYSGNSAAYGHLFPFEEPEGEAVSRLMRMPHNLGRKPEMVFGGVYKYDATHIYFFTALFPADTDFSGVTFTRTVLVRQ